MNIGKNNFNIRFLIVVLAALVLGCISVYLPYILTHLDLGQIVYTIYFLLPLSSLITGIVSHTALRRIWTAPVISAVSFSAVIVLKYNARGLVYIPAYVTISILGYLAASGVKRLIKLGKNFVNS